jgi:hypothetical protein
MRGSPAHACRHGEQISVLLEEDKAEESYLGDTSGLDLSNNLWLLFQKFGRSENVDNVEIKNYANSIAGFYGMVIRLSCVMCHLYVSSSKLLNRF